MNRRYFLGLISILVGGGMIPRGPTISKSKLVKSLKVGEKFTYGGHLYQKVNDGLYTKQGPTLHYLDSVGEVPNNLYGDAMVMELKTKQLSWMGPECPVNA